MKTTIVPAQITTVEDKIAGNFSFSQIILLLCALFSSTFIFIGIPPQVNINFLKIILMIFSSSFFLLMALRIKGKVLFQWLILILSFYIRVRQFAFNKNDITLRDLAYLQKPKRTKPKKSKKEAKRQLSSQAFEDQLALERLLAIDGSNVSLRIGKKGIRGYVT